MVGTTLKVRDATFTKVANFNMRLPFINGLVGEHVYGVDATQSVKNLANPSIPSTIVGTPTYGTHYAVIKTIVASQGFNLGYNWTVDATVIHVVQQVAAQPCWSMNTVAPISGFFNAAGGIFLANSNTGTANQPTFAMPVHGNYFVVAGTMPPSAKHRAHLWTGGVRAMNEAGANGGAARGGGLIVSGTSTSGATTGTSNLAYTAIFNRILTDAELDLAYLSLKNFYTGKIVIS
jgi:hypothetical protein